MNTFLIGDTVKTARDPYGSYGSDLSISCATVLDFKPRYKNDSFPDLVVRDHKSGWCVTVRDSRTTLVSPGDGTVIPGVTYPFTAEEIREQRQNDFDKKLLSLDLSHQGWSNPATYLANLYLSQEPKFHTWVATAYRKDGSLNPRRIEKEFGRLNLYIDRWAFDFPVDIPDGLFTRRSAFRLKVNWQEIAEEWRRK